MSENVMDGIFSIGVVTPCFNESENIEVCLKETLNVVRRNFPKAHFQHLFIDNNSNDGSQDVLRKAAESFPHVRVILNSSNYGAHNSPYYGMLQLETDVVIPIMADLQTPPNLICELIRSWREGNDLVMAVRKGMLESRLVRYRRSFYYWAVNRLSPFPHTPHFIGFGLYSRRVISVLRGLNEPSPYLRGLVAELGFRSSTIEFDQPKRERGRSKQTFYGLFDYAVLGIVTSTLLPIYLLFVIGLVIALGTVLFSALASLFGQFWQIPENMTWGFGETLIVFLLAVQLMSLGLIGMYVAIALRYIRNRPLVVEFDRIGWED